MKLTSQSFGALSRRAKGRQRDGEHFVQFNSIIPRKTFEEIKNRAEVANISIAGMVRTLIDRGMRE